MEDASKRRRELEAVVLDKVGEVISAERSAKRVDQVICALHSLAVLLFPLDYSSLLSGSIDQRYRNQVLSAKVPPEEERWQWWQAFYRRAAYPTLARVLLLGGEGGKLSFLSLVSLRRCSKEKRRSREKRKRFSRVLECSSCHHLRSKVIGSTTCLALPSASKILHQVSIREYGQCFWIMVTMLCITN